MAGILASRRFAVGATLLVLLVAAAGACALVQPAAGPLDAVPALVTALVGLAVLAYLVRGGGSPAQARRGDAATSRRGFLLGAGAVAGVAIVLAGTGQWIIRTRNKISDIVLPKAAKPLPALAAGLEEKYDGISPFVTPRGDFYRVDTNLTVPVVDVDSWKLTIDGDVDKEVSFTFDELTKMNVVEHDITLTCVSNEVGGKLVGSARWLGVPLRDVLDRAGVGDKADQILSTAVDGFTISTPLEVALDGRNSILAFGMNGEPLPREHGFPVRLITPGHLRLRRRHQVAGEAHPDDVRRTRGLLDQAQVGHRRTDQALQPRRHASAPLHHRRRPDRHRRCRLGTARRGRQGRGPARRGDWQEAKLGPSAGVEYWRQWYLPWKATSAATRSPCAPPTGPARPRRPPGRPRSPTAPAAIQEVVVTVS